MKLVVLDIQTIEAAGESMALEWLNYSLGCGWDIPVAFVSGLVSRN